MEKNIVLTSTYFITGFILLFICFWALYKIPKDCDSKKLKNKIEQSVILGSILTSSCFIYFLCLIKKGCNCPELTSSITLKIILFIMLCLGIYLFILVWGIKKDLKKCNIDLKFAPDLLLIISVIQIIIPIVYFILNNKSKKLKEESKHSDKDNDSKKEIKDKKLNQLLEQINILDEQIYELNIDKEELNTKILKKEKEIDNIERKTGKLAPSNKRKQLKLLDLKLDDIEDKLKDVENNKRSVEDDIYRTRSSSRSVSRSRSSRRSSRR